MSLPQFEWDAALVCSHSAGGVLIAPPTHKQQLVVTVDGDGVACYDLRNQVKGGSVSFFDAGCLHGRTAAPCPTLLCPLHASHLHLHRSDS